MFKKVKTSLKNVASWGPEPFHGPGFGSYLRSINSLPFLYYLHPLINKVPTFSKSPRGSEHGGSAIPLLPTVLTTFPSLKDLAFLLSWIRSRAPTTIHHVSAHWTCLKPYLLKLGTSVMTTIWIKLPK